MKKIKQCLVQNVDTKHPKLRLCLCPQEITNLGGNNLLDSATMTKIMTSVQHLMVGSLKSINIVCWGSHQVIILDFQRIYHIYFHIFFLDTGGYYGGYDDEDDPDYDDEDTDSSEEESEGET